MARVLGVSRCSLATQLVDFTAFGFCHGYNVYTSKLHLLHHSHQPLSCWEAVVERPNLPPLSHDDIHVGRVLEVPPLLLSETRVFVIEQHLQKCVCVCVCVGGGGGGGRETFMQHCYHCYRLVLFVHVWESLGKRLVV